MTKRFLFAIALLAVVVSSCKKDEVIPSPDIAGIYNFTSATLIDGDIANSATTDMLILMASKNPDADPPYSATAVAGDVPTTSFFVNAVLSGLAPCKLDPKTSPWTYQINFKSDGGLAFICTSENDISVDNGKWEFTDNDKTVKLTIESSTLGTVVVEIEAASFVTGDSGVIKGTINSFPMVKNASEAVGATNLQFIAFNVVLSK